MIIGRQLVEDQYEEKLYSTGDDYLDEMLEKAFCEGYEYAQREFAYKAPYTQKQARNIIKQLNNVGFKGNSVDKVTLDVARKSRRAGMTREMYQRNAKAVAAATGKSGMAGRNIARKLNAGEKDLIKRGLV